MSSICVNCDHCGFCESYSEVAYTIGNILSIVRSKEDANKRKQQFIEWLETYPLNGTMEGVDMMLEIVDKAKEML